MRQATVCIDPQALKSNFNHVKQLAPKAKIVSMVKSNAYGHGVAACIDALSDTDAFGVACLAEALELRQLGVKQDITLIEGVFSAAEMTLCIEQRLEVVVHHQDQLDALLAQDTAYMAQGLKVWVKLNSGMNRLGFNKDEIIPIIHKLKQLGFNCVLAMHFANADCDHPMNDQQIQQFLSVKTACAPILASCCNSAAIYKWPELHFDYVRPGIMLYGASPFAERGVHELGLSPVMQFSSAIMAIHSLQAGEYVGYASSFQAPTAMKIAIVSIGYGDGYPRAYVQPNTVYVAGQTAALVGRVSMDMMAIDITTLDVQLGDPVELWGKQRLVDDVAACNGTVGYELLCQITQRPLRKLLNSH